MSIAALPVTFPSAPIGSADTILYPTSDGKPMAENTLQLEWIMIIKNGLDWLFADDLGVFVAGDLLWYPVEGQPTVRMAPDVMVAFGRPKGYRGSYLQWNEDGIAPQVVFEILSLGNRPGEMAAKAGFYNRYGVEEYYLYDPFSKSFSALLRSVISGFLEEVPLSTSGFVSPRLGVRFDTSSSDLVLYRPDGEPFKSFVSISQERDAANDRADSERNAREKLAAKLRELGIDPDTI